MRNETEVELVALYKGLSKARMDYISSGEKADNARANLILKEMTLILDVVGRTNAEQELAQAERAAVSTTGEE